VLSTDDVGSYVNGYTTTVRSTMQQG